MNVRWTVLKHNEIHNIEKENISRDLYTLYDSHNKDTVTNTKYIRTAYCKIIIDYTLILNLMVNDMSLVNMCNIMCSDMLFKVRTKSTLYVAAAPPC